MRAKGDNPDRVISSFGARQHGVVSRRQLLGAGLSSSAIGRRLEAGRLHRVHQGVYAVGYPTLSRERRWMAAVLAGGEGAVLSHRSAASLWGMLPMRTGPVETSVPVASGRGRRRGIVLHRRPTMLPGHCSYRREIPVTTPAVTISDLHQLVSSAELRQAIRQAEVRGLDTGLSDPPDPTRSELEHIFLELCKQQKWPMPEVNVRVGSRLVDFLWRERRVVVETDGYRYHRGHSAFEDDHARDLELRLLGYDLVRPSYWQVVNDQHRVIAAVEDAFRKARS
jgi:hypothetical protein